MSENLGTLRSNLGSKKPKEADQPAQIFAYAKTRFSGDTDHSFVEVIARL